MAKLYKFAKPSSKPKPIYGITRKVSTHFPDTITSNDIVFHLEGTYSTKSEAQIEAGVTKRHGYYIRIIKRNGRYAVYSALKR